MSFTSLLLIFRQIHIDPNYSTTMVTHPSFVSAGLTVCMQHQTRQRTSISNRHLDISAEICRKHSRGILSDRNVNISLTEWWCAVSCSLCFITQDLSNSFPQNNNNHICVFHVNLLNPCRNWSTTHPTTQLHRHLRTRIHVFNHTSQSTNAQIARHARTTSQSRLRLSPANQNVLTPAVIQPFGYLLFILTSHLCAKQLLHHSISKFPLAVGSSPLNIWCVSSPSPEISVCRADPQWSSVSLQQVLA